MTAPTVTGKAEANAYISLYDGSKFVAATVANSAGLYSMSPTLTEGSHSLKVTATDAAGNVSVASPAKIVTIDTTLPTAAITSAGGNVTTASQTINGTGEVGTSISLTDNGTAIGTAVTVGSNGLWSAKVTLSSGSNSIVANDTDKAGNVGTSSAVVYQFGAWPAAQASSLHSMVQAMSTMTASPSGSMTPIASAAPQDAHPLAAAHA